jgi:hypothetical protein
LSRVPFDELEIRKQKRFKKNHYQRSVAENKFNIIGLDTETYMGRCKIICDSLGRSLEPENLDELLDFLTYKEYRGKILFWYNIRFDVQSILKWMNKKQIYEVYLTGRCKYKDYVIQYINQKYLKITVGHKCYNFYDLANFLTGGLNYLANKYLNEEKLDIVDSTRLNDDMQYWNDNKEDIIKYCIRDAVLTQKLAVYFWSYMNESLGFSPRSPFSKGSISQEFFLYKCYIPSIDYFLQNDITLDILRHAYYAYSGGRFELLKRGYFKEVYLYDIKSAYPAEIADLIDYREGYWIKDKNFERYDRGFWYCNVEFYHDIISPFMQKVQGLNIYPNGKFNVFLTKKEIDFILKNFKEVSINSISGYGFILRMDKNKVPFLPRKPFGLMEYIYRLKEEAITEEKRNAQKIIANSLYGKFIQTAGGHTGKLFNPLWSAEITANVRLKLMEVALTGNNIDNIIGFSTDSIFTTKPIQDKFIGSDMGEWELKYHGTDGIFLMTDIYSIKTEKENKHKLRGFKIKLKKDDEEKDWITVYNIIHKLDKDLKFRYKITRPINLGECIIQNKVKNLDMLNIWKEDVKEISINGDTKRIWEDDFHSGEECMQVEHSSNPILI